MRLLKLTCIMLFTSSIYAQPVQIDMHGGKETKIPSNLTSKPASILSDTMGNIASLKPFVQKEFYTVEEIHMWRKSLQDKTVTVLGTATKIARGIMKRDWVHIGDGTGNKISLNNDLVFTAPNTTFKAGDKVKASGKVIVDKDFGYGYFYKVILENATFEVK